MTKPTLDTDRRGVSEVIGSILVFGLLIMLVSLLQVQAIPNANEEVEFEHSQQVRGDFSELQVAIDKTLDSGRSQSASVQMGTDYPSRLLFYNPPSSSGTLRTTEKGTMTISNVQSDSDAGVFFDEMGNDVEYDTRSLTYSVGYHELANSPTDVREPAVAYRYENDVALVSETNLVDGTEINLVAIGGELDAGGVTSEKIEAKALSAPAKTYTVQDTGDPVTIEVSTSLSQSKWRELLSDEMGANGHVETVTVDDGILKVELNTTTQYTLRTSKVGFGQGGAPGPSYMVSVDDDDPTAATVEVRDTFNNPVSGVTLDIEGSSHTVTTGPDGRAEYSPSSATSVTFEKDFDGNGTATTPLEKVTAYLHDDVVLTDAKGSRGSDTVEIELLNSGSTRTVESLQVHYITEYRGVQIAGVGEGEPVGATNVVDGPDAITDMEVRPGPLTSSNASSSSSGFGSSDPTENGPPQQPNSLVSVPSGVQTLTVTFDDTYSFNTGISNDALAVRVTFYFADGSQGTYDVMLQSSDDS